MPAPEAALDFVVGAEEGGERLDVVLAARVGSRSAAQKLIEAGRVRVDGTRRAKRQAVAAGAHVAIAPATATAPEPVAAAPFAIAWEDPHVLVVDKPPGVVVYPGHGRADGTLVQALAGRVAGGSDPERPGVVHRLDRDTSGLLVFARDAEAHAALSAAMAAREIHREYLALAEGRPPARHGTIDAPVGRDRRIRTRISTDTDEPRAAVTHFELERALPETSLLRLRLETGRTHQIRAHLEAIGHPVAGDPDYGTAGRYGLARQFLHATRLAFAHPVTGERVDVVSPLPADLARALERASEPPD